MRLPKLPPRDLLWLLVIVGLLLAWVYSDTSLRRRLTNAEDGLSNRDAELASFKQRENVIARQEEEVAEQRDAYTALIKDAEIVMRKCESILDDYADLKGKPRLGITGELK